MADTDIYALGIHKTTETLGRRSSTSSEIIDHLQILIRGIALHAIEGDPGDLKQLQSKMSGIADSLKMDSSPDDMLIGISKTLRSLEEYNRRAGGIFRAQADELRNILGSMTATMLFINSSSDASVRQLSTIESKLQRASTLEDMRQVKACMVECLTLVRTESLRLQSESKTKIEALQNDVERLSRRLKAVSTNGLQDPLTGLPGRAAAEEAISAKMSAGSDFLTALFTFDRMASINGRFGRLVGDNVLVAGAQMLAQKLSGIALYRWSGPAFAAVFDPSVNLLQAETRASQAASMRLERNLETGDRSVLIVITTTCHLERVSAKLAPDAVFRSLDAAGASPAASG